MRDDSSIEFMNRDTENKLQYPASHATTDAKLRWLKGELDRIFRQSNGVSQMVIKTNEFAGSENKSKRESTYAEAVCILTAAEQNVPVSCKLYSQIGSTSSESKRHAEERVGRTDKYWDNKIADAVLAAFSAR
jgi:hypothetical protein